MRNLKTEILIIGGGATGTGLVRDLALRGFNTILVEKGDLANATTGRYHGLLHSGGRYVVKDPLAARECIAENKILRRIMPECIEDTGGFFVLTPQDDPAYAPVFIEGCQQAGIPCEEISISQMLHAEPLLDPRISRCFRVPDASADSFLAADINAESARQHGATILRYHTVQRLITSDSVGNTNGSAVISGSPCVVHGAVCHDLVKDEEVWIEADLVINATGAWVGKITATAGITVTMTPGKGILMAANHRLVNTIINRCKMPGDGDILVPAHTVTVIGTTDVKVEDPDHFGIDPWEVQLMLDEGEKVIPGFRKFRFLRAWAGVRPLYQEINFQNPEGASGNRDITRAFVLLDHAQRDGVAGLLTITSGKWTTYRKMAEVTADKACEKLGVQRACRTHLETLPSPGSRVHGAVVKARGVPAQEYHYLGHRLAQIEAGHAYGNLICECELATREDIAHAILEANAQTLDDIRRDIRLGMGPCQAGFCSLRAAGMLHQLASQQQQQTVEKTKPDSTTTHRLPTPFETNLALRDFLQERWKGVHPVLWGQQLRQERLNELIYLNVLNADHLPGPVESRLSPSSYAQEYQNNQSVKWVNGAPIDLLVHQPPFTEGFPLQPEVLVIGAGLAGLMTAWQAAAIGKKVKLIAKGWGATHWASGCIDVLGYYPPDRATPIASPAETLEKLVHTCSDHPYALAGIDSISLAIRNFQNLSLEAGYPLLGSLAENWMLPTALGTIRPTCLAPETMTAGDLRRSDPILIAGFEPFLDFFPALVADNLRAQNIPARAVMLVLPGLEKLRFVNGMTLARLFDKPEFRAEVVKALKPKLKNAARVGFPAVLGKERSLEVVHDLEDKLGCAVFEIPGLPPSIPGIRIHNLMVRAIQRSGGKIFDGMQVIGAQIQDNHLQSVWSETGTGQTLHRANTFVLATGGILGGGITTDPPGNTQKAIYETTLGLPIHTYPERANWLQQKFLGREGHPIFRIGLDVNQHFQPVDDFGAPVYDNLLAVGGMLANCDPVRERSLEGIAIVTGFYAGQRIEA
jgi:glycerol-3-phosphate dehydrogenase